jgi:hypothetical protein
VDEAKVQKILIEIIEAYNWIEADLILSNNLVNFLRKFSSLEIVKICTTREIKGISLAKLLLMKAQQISQKTPHTEGGVLMLKNLINTFVSFTFTIEFRLMLRNAKAYNMLEQLHPQLQKNRKSSWNDITLVWMKFFECLSKYEDTECNPG